MNIKIPFKQVDVFSKSSCMGNPVCVFLESGDLTTEEMQRIARWTNLSETTFISSSSRADYRVRIFTPSEELPFAGHPTLGSAWSFLESSQDKKESLVQECDFGLVNLQKSKEGIFFTLPHYEILKTVLSKDLTDALGVAVDEDSLCIDTGPHWIIAHVPGKQDLDSFKIDKKALKEIFAEGLDTGATLYSIQEGKVFVRTLFEANGEIIEDPVCGSGNAAVAVHLRESGRLKQLGSSYKAYQGKHVGRNGEILVEVGETIRIGGQCNTVFSGEASFSR